MQDPLSLEGPPPAGVEPALEPPAGTPAGIAGFPGPFPVGRYALRLRDRLRQFAGVCLIGELSGVKVGKVNVYFELRDGDGAIPCAMWRSDFDRLTVPAGEFRDGAEVVAAGGCDYYPGRATASPSFSFRVEALRLAGEGDLLARLDRLRRQLGGEGLFEPQKRLRMPLLPKSIGVITAEGSAARRDFLAGLARRSWQGTIVWAYAPVQDRRAAGAIAGALRDLAALGSVEAIVVTRGGGSIADLWAFCDETLCRTVALLPVPVVSAVGHDVDRTLIDDVSAVCCSTPTHAAEAVVGVDCAHARLRMLAMAERVDQLGRAAVLKRARTLGAHSRAPREHVARHRVQLHQKTREVRAASRRQVAGRASFQHRIAGTVLERKVAVARSSAAAGQGVVRARASGLDRAARALSARQAEALRAQAASLRAGDPDRVLERGYGLVLDHAGEPLASADAVRHAGNFDLRMTGGTVPARLREDGVE